MIDLLDITMLAPPFAVVLVPPTPTRKRLGAEDREDHWRAEQYHETQAQRQRREAAEARRKRRQEEEEIMMLLEASQL